MHRRFGNHSQAVAGVIEALLMVALVSIVISTIQLVYIPQVMEQKESEHMDLVSNQLSTLKSMIDLQGMTKSSAPISSMVTLGSRDLPYFITAKAYGGISVKQNPKYNVTVFMPLLHFPSGVPLTSIQYDADNSYFIDQSYILEGGGLIVQQPDGTPVMRADPSIAAHWKDSNTITINFNLTKVVAIAGKNQTYGEGNCFIRTNYSSNIKDSETLVPGEYIHIYTAYPNAWNESLYNLIGDYANHGYIQILSHTALPTSYIEIKPVNKSIDFQLNINTIYVQIGQGWVN